jgi:hypothetical protein
MTGPWHIVDILQHEDAVSVVVEQAGEQRFIGAPTLRAALSETQETAYEEMSVEIDIPLEDDDA